MGKNRQQFFFTKKRKVIKASRKKAGGRRYSSSTSEDQQFFNGARQQKQRDVQKRKAGVEGTSIGGQAEEKKVSGGPRGKQLIWKCHGRLGERRKQDRGKAGADI